MLSNLLILVQAGEGGLMAESPLYLGGIRFREVTCLLMMSQLRMADLPFKPRTPSLPIQALLEQELSTVKLGLERLSNLPMGGIPAIIKGKDRWTDGEQMKRECLSPCIA